MTRASEQEETVVSHIQRIDCQPEKTTLHGGQSHSWSAEQGEKEEGKKSGSAPPRCSFGENKIKIMRRTMHRRYAGFGPSRVRTRIS